MESDRKTQEDKMLYRQLGNSGLRVSVIGFGNWVTGHDLNEQENQTKIIQYAYSQGVNFFDTAEVYGNGKAEQIMGNALKSLNADRSDLVITTKLFWSGNSQNKKGNSRKHLLEGIKTSLKNLQLDYVDIVFSHRPDYLTPLEEICYGFHSIIQNNCAFYWGTSEWRPEMISRAIEICNKNGWHKPIVEQPQYNMLWRERFEKEYSYIFDQYKYGTTIWSPLCQGILTGKYNKGEIPEDSRMNKNERSKDRIWSRYFSEKKEENLKILNELQKLSEKLGVSQACLALAWCIVNQDVSVCLVGATKIEQMEENLKVLDLVKKWNLEIEKQVEEILRNEPEPEMDYYTWGNQKGRRAQRLYIGQK